MSILRGILAGGSGGGGGGTVTHPDRVIAFEFDNGGIVLPVGLTTIPIMVPFAHTVKSAEGVAFDTATGLAPTGSIQIDVWRDSYAAYPPTVADSITAAAKPTITAANKYSDSTLTGWSTSGAAGSYYLAKIVTVSGVVAAAFYLTVSPT